MLQLILRADERFKTFLYFCSILSSNPHDIFVSYQFTSVVFFTWNMLIVGIPK